MFLHGLLFGFNIITFCLTNRWLIFTDEGWKLRKQFDWLLLIITNILWAMSVADVAADMRIVTLQMDSIDDGHRPDEWVDPHWDGIVRVSFHLHLIGLKGTSFFGVFF